MFCNYIYHICCVIRHYFNILQVLVYDEEDGIITYNITVSPYEETDKFNMTSGKIL